MKINMIPVEKLKHSDAPKIRKDSPSTRTAMKKSLQYHGILYPFRVHPDENESGCYIVDKGNLRLDIINELNTSKHSKVKFPEVHCIVTDSFESYEASGKTPEENDCSDREEEKNLDTKAHYAAITLRLCQSGVDKEALTLEVLRLREERKLGYGAIAQRIGRSRSGVKKLLKSFEAKSSEPMKSATGLGRNEMTRIANGLKKLQEGLSKELLDTYGEAIAKVNECLKAQIGNEAQGQRTDNSGKKDYQTSVVTHSKDEK